MHAAFAGIFIITDLAKSKVMATSIYNGSDLTSNHTSPSWRFTLNYMTSWTKPTDTYTYYPF